MKANDKTLQVMRVYKEYLPRFYNSSNYKFTIIDVVLKNDDFVDDVLGFIQCTIWEECLKKMNIFYQE